MKPSLKEPLMPVPSGHIRLDDRGVAWIDDRNVKVIEIAAERIAYGWSVDDLFREHDGYLSLAQIHAALAYYYDNQAAMDAEIERQDREFDQLRQDSLGSPLRQRLRELGKTQ